jgi:hypothetical protein
MGRDRSGLKGSGETAGVASSIALRHECEVGSNHADDINADEEVHAQAIHSLVVRFQSRRTYGLTYTQARTRETFHTISTNRIRKQRIV